MVQGREAWAQRLKSFNDPVLEMLCRKAFRGLKAIGAPPKKRSYQFAEHCGTVLMKNTPQMVEQALSSDAVMHAFLKLEVSQAGT